jgi:hypothetical protein
MESGGRVYVVWQDFIRCEDDFIFDLCIKKFYKLYQFQ